MVRVVVVRSVVVQPVWPLPAHRTNGPAAARLTAADPVEEPHAAPATRLFHSFTAFVTAALYCRVTPVTLPPVKTLFAFTLQTLPGSEGHVPPVLLFALSAKSMAPVM